MLGLVFVPAPALFCFAAACFTSGVLYKLGVISEKIIPVSSLSCLAMGLIMAAILSRPLVRNAYKFNNKVLVGFYIFYSMLAFGLGMGIPVLNYILGMASGVYMVRKMCYLGADEAECKLNIKKTAIFTTVIMAILCCLMVLIGLAGRISGKDFENLFTSLFGFKLTINTAGFVGMIFCGACAMILLQYLLTRLSAKITFKLSR